MSDSQLLTPEQKLHRIFADLFELSTQQMEALDNENFDKLAELLSKKDEMLRELKALNEEPERVSEILNRAARIGGEEGLGLRELVRRYQAHEKYIVRQVQLKLNAVGDKLRNIRIKKSAASGYHSGSKEISKFDMSS
ncbi:hypothetical protein EH220_01170 [bacterium]|nr:MAG: hypothetical protein EH220_01170 [bacterium]